MLTPVGPHGAHERLQHAPPQAGRPELLVAVPPSGADPPVAVRRAGAGVRRACRIPADAVAAIAAAAVPCRRARAAQSEPAPRGGAAVAAAPEDRGRERRVDGAHRAAVLREEPVSSSTWRPASPLVVELLPQPAASFPPTSGRRAAASEEPRTRALPRAAAERQQESCGVTGSTATRTPTPSRCKERSSRCRTRPRSARPPGSAPGPIGSVRDPSPANGRRRRASPREPRSPTCDRALHRMLPSPARTGMDFLRRGAGGPLLPLRRSHSTGRGREAAEQAVRLGAARAGRWDWIPKPRPGHPDLTQLFATFKAMLGSLCAG
jgi:hypothetical protein